MRDDKKKFSGVFIMIVGILIICVGVGMYFSHSNDSSRKKGEEKEKGEKIEVDDARFISLYNGLKDFCYAVVRIDNKSFSKAEYLSLVGKDITDSDIVRTDEAVDGDFYYTLSGSKVLSILQKYFGSSFTIDKNSLVGLTGSSNIGLNGRKNDINVISYDSGTDNYKIALVAALEEEAGAKINEQMITSAVLKKNSIIVEAKAIYIDSTDFGEEVEYNIYADTSKNDLLDTKKYAHKDLASKTISVEKYKDKATTIMYQFDLDKASNSYYFANSML